MIVLFAPAKTFSKSAIKTQYNSLFKEKTNQLIDTLKQYSKDEIKALFKTSDTLSTTVFDYYNNYSSSDSYLPLSLYEGEAYKTLNYATLSKEALDYLNNHLYIIDALYGILKPETGIKPYRLDFTVSGLNLKSFWKETINAYLATYQDHAILSLASKEFSSLIDTKLFNLYEVSFLDFDGKKYKAISVFNKQNRGLLLRYIATKNITTIEGLPKTFHGYKLEIKDKEIVYKRKVV